MKAYSLFEWKKPARLVDIPIPEPEAGQVRLKVAGNGICASDLHFMHEWDLTVVLRNTGAWRNYSLK